jgi:hypothetical protein
MRMHALCLPCVGEAETGERRLFFFEGQVLDDCTIVGVCEKGPENRVGLRMSESSKDAP